MRTRDYAAVPAHGLDRAVEDVDWKKDVPAWLTNRPEAGRQLPWRIAHAPASCIERMSRAIVGIEIPIGRPEARLEASQDGETPDRPGTVAGPGGIALGAGNAMADLVRMATDARTPSGR